MNFSKIIRLKKILSIELIILESGYWFNVIEVAIVNNRLRITPNELASNDINVFLDQINKELPVCLTISGKGILIKQISVTQQSEVSAIKASFMLNSIDDYFFQSTEIHDDKIWTSIVRKEIIFKILDIISSHGIKVIDLFIGPLSVSSLASLISSEIFKTSYYNIVLHENIISQISIQNNGVDNYLIGSKRIEGRDLLALASAYKLLVINKSQPQTALTSIIVQNNDYKINKLLSNFSKYALIGLFIVLLINFFIFSHYNKKLSQHNVQSMQARTLLAQKDSLLKELTEKENVFAQYGIKENSKIAFYSDSITASKPQGIIFNQLLINPATIDLNNKALIIEKQKIIIRGTANTPADINTWIYKLSKISWVDSLNLNELVYSSSKRKIDFSIQFKVSDDFIN